MIKEAVPYVFDLIDKYRPKSYCEIGCHEGLTSRLICHKILKYYPRLSYFGYDVFKEVEKKERNGKSTPAEEKIYNRLVWLQRKYKHFNYNIIKGYTIDTLTAPRKYGLVYIDGGHSYETVLHDYSMIKDSKIILFDDYNLPGVKEAVDEIGKGYQLPFSTPNGKNKKCIIVN